MFIRVKTEDDYNLVINTSQIVVMSNNTLKMSAGQDIVLSPESQSEVEENLFGLETNTTPKATEFTANLLNELHKLLGGRGEAKPTTDRKARLKARMKDFNADELKLAATNLGQDEFMQGANDNNKRYGTIDYLLRTSANVNKWLEEQPQKKKGMF